MRMQGRIAILRPCDRAFLHAHATEYNRILDKLRDNGAPHFVLDLSGCDYISSEGISNVTRSWKWCYEENNGTMAVVVPQDTPGEIRNLFDLIGVSRVLGTALQSSVEEGILHLQRLEKTEAPPNDSLPKS
jgi:anti-anti-sigma regulatory factor